MVFPKGNINPAIRNTTPSDKPMSAKPYKCRYPGCDKSFKGIYNRTKHEKYVHGPPRYQCSISGCGKIFKTKESLNIHIRDTHSDTSSYKCNYPSCSKAYKHLSSLQRHIRDGHGSQIYRCSICRKTYTKQDSLYQHVRFKHNFDESTRIPCIYQGCVKSFKRKGNLNRHIREVHRDVSPHICPYTDCNKTYKSKKSLNEHIQLDHKGYRPYICKKCGKMYKYLPDLRYHLEHNLCWSVGRRRNQSKIMKDHHNAVNQLKNYLRKTKNPKSISTELVLPNKKRPDLLIQCPKNRRIGFDVTIGRKNPVNLNNQIIEKFDRNYEKFCDIVYIFVISKVKKTLQTIQECNRSPMKPKEVRVVHWRTIIQNNSKYTKIFQQIEDKTAL